MVGREVGKLMGGEVGIRVVELQLFSITCNDRAIGNSTAGDLHKVCSSTSSSSSILQPRLIVIVRRGFTRVALYCLSNVTLQIKLQLHLHLRRVP